MDIEPIPMTIVKATCRVMSSLNAVKRNGTNSFGGYKFASTDDVFAEVMPRMAEAGLMCLPIELDDPEIMRLDVSQKDGTKTQQWMRIRYGFVLATAEETWFDKRNARTLMIQITGPQTFQAAASFAEKAYLRSLFKLPTGDMDLDMSRQVFALQELPDEKPSRKSSYKAKKDGTDQLFNEIKRHISNAQTHDALNWVESTYRGDIDTLPSKWAQLIEDELEDRRMGMAETAA